MHQNHALFGLDPAVVHMAIKAPEHAPADLKRKIAFAAQRAKDGKTFAPMPKRYVPSAKFISVSYKVPHQGISYSFSYTVKDIWHNGNPTLQELIQKVAEKYGVSVEDIKSARRTHAIMKPRLEFYYRARTETFHSYPTIGRFCGNRDHTTVLSGAIKHAKTHGVSLPESRQEQAA